MENYQLQNNEVPLYRGQITLLPVSKKDTLSEAELVLSNLNFIFTMEVRQGHKKISQTEVYDLQSVKFYNELPYVIKKGDVIELYLLACEKFIKFPNKKEATTFHDTVMRLLSGNSKLVRAVKKVKKEINETEEALDVDITGAAKVVADVALDVAGTVTGGKEAGKWSKGIAALTSAIKKKKEEKKLLSNEQSEIKQIEE